MQQSEAFAFAADALPLRSPAMAAETQIGRLDDIAPESARVLLVAGIEAFAELGYHATTTREIAARARMSPAALYVHYPSKARLLAEIVKLGHHSALETFQQAFADEVGPAERIAAAVRNFTVWHAENSTLARVVQYELDALPPKERRGIGVLRTQFEDMLQAEIERGIRSETFSVSDVGGTSTAIFSLCIDVARWYSPRSTRSPQEIGALYGELALRLVSAPAS